MELSENEAEQLMRNMIAEIKEYDKINIDIHKQIAILMAKMAAIGINRLLNEQEMQHIIGQLFACEQPDISPEGKPTLIIIGMEELYKRL
jgi:DNA mismatch repair protein MutL